MNIEMIARDIVHAVVPLIGGCQVFITDRYAVVVASTEKCQRGAVEQDAKNLLVSGGPSLRAQCGGISRVVLPLTTGGRVEGTLGISGRSEEVDCIAGLVQLYAEQCLNGSLLASKQPRQQKLRQALLETLLGDAENMQEEAQRLCGVLSMRLALPMRAVVVLPGLGGGGQRQGAAPLQVESMLGALFSAGLIKQENDVYGTAAGAFVLLHHVPSLQEDLGGGRAARIYGVLCDLPGAAPPVVARGGSCSRTGQLRASFQEAFCLGAMENGGFFDIENNSEKMKYLMASVQPKASDRFIAQMYAQLCGQFGEGEMDEVMRTLSLYCGCKVLADAAQQLGIHKNTLIYRMKKIFAALGLEEEDAFTREYFLRMLLIYHRFLKQRLWKQ